MAGGVEPEQVACEDVLACESVQTVDDIIDGTFAVDAKGCRSVDVVDLGEQEAELTREVPTLFENMNWAASDINSIELQIEEAQERHRRLLLRWSRLYDDARMQCGEHINKARSYFEQLQVLNESSRRAQCCARRFSAAQARHEEARCDLQELERLMGDESARISLDQHQQDCLSRATLRLLRCQQERDLAEKEHAQALMRYLDAQATDQRLQKQVGKKSINKGRPFFQQLEATQAELTAEQHRISALEERVRDSKGLYKGSMSELDRINRDVHEARRLYADQEALRCRQANSSDTNSPPELCPERSPEISPEPPSPSRSEIKPVGFSSQS